jgi:DNA-binding XRE family transcriptional regulator
MARALTGFSRQEFYEKIGIATSTIDTWESGRVELTEKSAIRVCSALRKLGIYCTSEWLLGGSGAPPRLMDELEKSVFLPNGGWNIEDEFAKTQKTKRTVQFIDRNMRRELSFFTNLHKDAIFHIVEEDFLNSRFKIGDCVAGIEEGINSLVGKVIIGVRGNGETMLCKLVSFSGTTCQIFLNKDKKDSSCEFVKAAEVIWHRICK